MLSERLRTAAMALLAAASMLTLARAENSTYYNPVFPGWNSDPTCTHVDGTFYCAVSTFVAFPGLPVYASTDLIHWKLISHAWNRESQLPGITKETRDDSGGMYAPNLRYHAGKFYLTCAYLSSKLLYGTTFVSPDPYNNSAWSDPIQWSATSIDPDLFWDDDGTVHLITAGIRIAQLDLHTGAVTATKVLWDGTGGSYPEGPHVYKKHDWFYLMIAEGGTGLTHMETIARSRNISGPYEAYSKNPILSNANTTEYFQTVGHADLFQDSNGNWWGVALSTRSGPDLKIYPMGREAVLYPVDWSGDWPIASQVRGIMTGWELPHSNNKISGNSAPFEDDDDIDFAPGSSIPSHLMTLRYPPTTDNTFKISPGGSHSELVISPSRTNLTGIINDKILDGLSGIAFLARKQTHTLFTFTVDLDYNPQLEGQEAGITAFITRYQHLDISIRPKANATPQRELVFRIEASGKPDSPYKSSEQAFPIPSSWPQGPIRLQIHTANDTHYVFSAMPSSNPAASIILGTASAEILSGGIGRFIGTLVGVFATCNGGAGSGNVCEGNGGDAHFSRWRYSGAAQKISDHEYVTRGVVHSVL
ncbi:glycoside hydrolase family 43 protein [Pseudocercospora fijiensis CIRAD86]|uniref:Glycoside hydrolase family 43 protein n=1 Tax=Pseudocercospora fijiensis (strain CIRAD86) TaxID=383855 RepID=M3AX19_PSEFD|nr:glycoside hydrolase family 43 protein [Pseudocercospora fijiensis CIRAD86]EME82017.1 glycoside hydrolase family 43 protein [Pseudocercospora fijiensis CIRAD86]